MVRGLRFTVMLTLWLPSAIHALLSFEDRCSSFTPEAHVYNSTRYVLEYVTAGSNLTFPDNDPTCARPAQLVEVNLCRVALSVPTSNRSSISLELWLPEDWSFRFLGTGNGGIDGCKFHLGHTARRAKDNSLCMSELMRPDRYQVRGSCVHNGE